MTVYLVLFVVFLNGENGVITRAHPDLASCEVAKIRTQPVVDETLAKNTDVRGYNLDCTLTQPPKRTPA